MLGKLGFSFLSMSDASLTEIIPLLNHGSIMAKDKLENCTDRVKSSSSGCPHCISQVESVLVNVLSHFTCRSVVISAIKGQMIINNYNIKVI